MGGHVQPAGRGDFGFGNKGDLGEIRVLNGFPRPLAASRGYSIAGRPALVDNMQKGRVTKWTRIDRCRRLSHSLAPLEGWL